jgi:glutamate synthase (NADPH) large chain
MSPFPTHGTDVGMRPRQGLYDPAFEHDACGVGFVADVRGRRSTTVVQNALEVLSRLGHRGAIGSEVNTGDGAGILLQLPDRWLRAEAATIGITLPAAGRYGVGMVFLPTDAAEQAACEGVLEEAIAGEGLVVLGWRTVPTDGTSIGPSARRSQPSIRQVFVGCGDCEDDGVFERRLYLARKDTERRVRESDFLQKDSFYISSLSARTIVYKGMLTADQLHGFYPDLESGGMDSALALVHARFSTNTFPSWSRAHPNRIVAHNGEINTLRGNVNWMSARERMLASPLFGEDLARLRPVVDAGGSDSAMLDNVLEMLTLGGRDLPHAVMMMIPEPWSKHTGMSAETRAFYEYHSCLMEPWDGPAALCFTDGVRIGAVLDRNGLRPLRYSVTSDGLVVMASEAGVLDLPPGNVVQKGRVRPGQMFLVDTSEQRIIPDGEIKNHYASALPYAEWVRDNLVPLDALPHGGAAALPDFDTLLTQQRAFGYTREDLDLIRPMATAGGEAIGSMGTDTPLAVLSDRPKALYDYFKQLFAQVTNPPLDAIREEIVVSTGTVLGAERNLLDPQPESARLIRLRTPVLLNEQLERLRALDGSEAAQGFRARTLPALFMVATSTVSTGDAPLADGNTSLVATRGRALTAALDDLCRRAAEAVEEGVQVLILSDRGHSAERAPIPALLACSAVHHHLVRQGSRTRVGLVVETGDVREVHHLCVLVGYGADAVNPYLAFDSIAAMVREGSLDLPLDKAYRNYVKAATKGLVKVISKMGISTVQSYHGAQVFEAIGLGHDLVATYFTGTPSRVGGIDVETLAEEIARRHDRAYPSRPMETAGLDSGGEYQYRSDGEHHLFSPTTIHKLQASVRTGRYELYREYAEQVNQQARKLATLRGLMELHPIRPAVPLDEVEPVESIVRRFKSGAMSYGSISQEAHETLAIAMNRLGGRSNSGEGGEDPERMAPLPNGDSRNSAIKQVASGRFGVTSAYLNSANEIQIKMAQGAKPGEGGQLPGEKVYPWIARVRHSTPGVGLISPPPHHDIYSIEDLAQLIHDLKCANDHARISVKLVAEVGVGTVAAGVAKAKSDVVLISGNDGGTGASPLTSIKHAGGPWELGLAETQQTLVLNDLRSRITVEVDGQLKTGRDVVIGALLGAEEFGFATAPLVALGCVVMRVCHLNTCPVGVATQDPELRKRFAGKPEHVVNFMRFVAEDVREIMAGLGFRTFDEMVGHAECLEMREAVDHWKARGVDLSGILYQPSVDAHAARSCRIAQDHGIELELDDRLLIPACRPALEQRCRVEVALPISNVHRTVGTRLGSEVTRRYGLAGLPEDTISARFEGSAGQSFGAFLPSGVSFTLEGEANDYVGKGLSGGRLVIHPPADAGFPAEESVIVGNVGFYGATSGEAFIRGVAGERFAVRNSGASAVVEGVGDHGCEYMTGGRVVVLGPTGRNFAAGMSGGTAYVLDESGRFEHQCNPEMVGRYVLEDPEEEQVLRRLLKQHAQLTGSTRAVRVLACWAQFKPLFTVVIPHDYLRVREAQRRSSHPATPEVPLTLVERSSRISRRALGA